LFLEVVLAAAVIIGIMLLFTTNQYKNIDLSGPRTTCKRIVVVDQKDIGKNVTIWSIMTNRKDVKDFLIPIKDEEIHVVINDNTITFIDGKTAAYAVSLIAVVSQEILGISCTNEQIIVTYRIPNPTYCWYVFFLIVIFILLLIVIIRHVTGAYTVSIK